MEAQSFFLRYLQETATCPYREPQKSSATHPIRCEIDFNIILQFLLVSSKWYFSFSFPIKSLHTFLFSPIRAICTAHLLLYDLINIEIFGDDSNRQCFQNATF